MSALRAGLDEEAEAFRFRPIEGGRPYVRLNAIYMRCRNGGRYARVTLVTAISLSSSGHEELLDCACFDGGGESAWAKFLDSLKTRGLNGVRLAVPDAHAGLVSAIARVLPGCSWQRCLTHIQRDIRGHVHSAAARRNNQGERSTSDPPPLTPQNCAPSRRTTISTNAEPIASSIH